MLIRNNDGEVVGEMNVSITQEGTVIRTNTMYQNGRPVMQNFSVRDRREDSALVSFQRPGSQDEHNRCEAIWNLNLRPARQGLCHSLPNWCGQASQSPTDRQSASRKDEPG